MHFLFILVVSCYRAEIGNSVSYFTFEFHVTELLLIVEDKNVDVFSRKI